MNVCELNWRFKLVLRDVVNGRNLVWGAGSGDADNVADGADWADLSELINLHRPWQSATSNAPKKKREM